MWMGGGQNPRTRMAQMAMGQQPTGRFGGLFDLLMKRRDENNSQLTDGSLDPNFLKMVEMMKKRKLQNGSSSPFGGGYSGSRYGLW